MRKKAEKEIREAVIRLGSRGNHPLDQVRVRTALHPRVFDKTILDMARVGTIQLFTGKAENMTRNEISDMVRQGEIIYVAFRFIDGTDDTPPEEPVVEMPPPEIFVENEPIVLILDGLKTGEWETFEDLCIRKGIRGEKVIESLVRAYVRQNI